MADDLYIRSNKVTGRNYLPSEGTPFAPEKASRIPPMRSAFSFASPDPNAKAPSAAGQNQDVVSKASGKDFSVSNTAVAGYKGDGARGNMNVDAGGAKATLDQVQDKKADFVKTHQELRGGLEQHIRLAMKQMENDPEMAGVSADDAVNSMLPQSNSPSILGVMAGMAATPFVGDVGNYTTVIQGALDQAGKLTPGQMNKVMARVQENISSMNKNPDQPMARTSVFSFDNEKPEKISPQINNQLAKLNPAQLNVLRLPVENQNEFKALNNIEAYFEAVGNQQETYEVQYATVVTTEKVQEAVQSNDVGAIARLANGNEDKALKLGAGVDISEIEYAVNPDEIPVLAAYTGLGDFKMGGVDADSTAGLSKAEEYDRIMREEDMKRRMREYGMGGPAQRMSFGAGVGAG